MPADNRYDLPRNADGFALIGDPRNDENLIVSQLHLAFLKFHNAVADRIEPDPAKQLAVFDRIRAGVTWRHQWIVLIDFLRRIADPAVVDDVLRNGRRLYQFNGDSPTLLGSPKEVVPDGATPGRGSARRANLPLRG